MSRLHTHLLSISIALLCTHAQAVNKCTTPDGKTVYQQEACPSNSKAQELSITVPTGTRVETWTFSKEKDSMTDEMGCFAVSPSQSTNFSRGLRSYSTVYLQIYMNPATSRLLLTVRTFNSGDVFHHDMSGQGIKIGDSPFVPLTKHLTQRALGIDGDNLPEVIGALQKSKDFRLRLKFWPYETLHDTGPISTIGFRQAMSQVMKCAAK